MLAGLAPVSVGRVNPLDRNLPFTGRESRTGRPTVPQKHYPCFDVGGSGPLRGRGGGEDVTGGRV